MNERRKRTRKSTNDYFLVYDLETEELIGRVMDLNAEGTMIISESPVEVPSTFQCRMVMPRMIGRHRYLFFEAESKWCRKNTRLGWYEAGYQLINTTDEILEIIEQLTGDWVIKDRDFSITVKVSDD
jgi:hypothetical protein